ncbi:MAG: hypothetical protein V3T84_09745 [Phycisphaerales bacterium]
MGQRPGGRRVLFHHGSYFTGGKEAILEVFRGTASESVVWNTNEGQNLIKVALEHFITTNAVEYSDTIEYADPDRGVPPGQYPFFNNTPDERYLNFEINKTADDGEILFASNYVQNGPTHILGFTHQRPIWEGIVTWYQPAEYQPNALDDLDENNFQILANEIVFAAEAGSGSADLDSDGQVGASDLLILLASWGPPICRPAEELVLDEIMAGELTTASSAIPS